MARLTSFDENMGLLVNEEERLLSSKGFIDKDEMYKIMRHLAEKLYEYENLEEQGLLLKLPCKDGDAVYTIDENNRTWKKCVVEAIYCGAYGTDNKWHVKIDGFHYDFSVIGKTVFLTQAEAEEALKGMERED